MKRKDSGLNNRFECKGEDGLWREVEIVSTNEHGNVSIKYVMPEKSSSESTKVEDGSHEQPQPKSKTQAKPTLADTVDFGRIRIRSERWSSNSGSFPLVGSYVLCDFCAWCNAANVVKEEQISSPGQGISLELIECIVLAVDAPRIQLQSAASQKQRPSIPIGSGDVTPSGVFFAEAPSPPRTAATAVPSDSAIAASTAAASDAGGGQSGTIADKPDGSDARSSEEGGGDASDGVDPARWLHMDTIWRPSCERCRIEASPFASPYPPPSPRSSVIACACACACACVCVCACTPSQPISGVIHPRPLSPLSVYFAVSLPPHSLSVVSSPRKRVRGGNRENRAARWIRT
jgi:hypothetical protein